MKISTLCKSFLVFTIFSFSQSALAFADIKYWYVSADLGIFQGNYDLIYNDLTDTIAQNIRQPIQQRGYTGGFALGYSQILCKNYFLGAEITGNIATNIGNFSSGSSSSAFSDKINIQDYVDVLIVPGFYITDSVALYTKAGISYAYIKNTIHSPTGFTPTFFTTNNNNYIWGVALSIGMKKFITSQIAIFSEYQYHDYHKLNLSGFQNFTANYSHSVKPYSQALVLGLSYLF